MGMIDAVHTEYDRREVDKTKKKLHLLRFIHLCTLSVILALLIVGPGLYVRQGWKGYCPDCAKDCPIVECGECYSVENNTKCLLSYNTHIKEVTTLRGYYGLAHFGLYSDLELGGQYASVVLTSLALFLAVPLSFMSCQIIKTPPAKRKKITMALQGSAIVLVIIIQGLNWFYAFCGNYTSNTMAKYDKEIKAWVDNKHMKKVSDDNKLVQCIVIAYFLVAVLAFIAMCLFILDMCMFYKLAQKDTAMQEPEPGETGKASSIPKGQPTKDSTTPKSTSASDGGNGATKPPTMPKLGSY